MASLAARESHAAQATPTVKHRGVVAWVLVDTSGGEVDRDRFLSVAVLRLIDGGRGEEIDRNCNPSPALGARHSGPMPAATATPARLHRRRNDRRHRRHGGVSPSQTVSTSCCYRVIRDYRRPRVVELRRRRVGYMLCWRGRAATNWLGTDVSRGDSTATTKARVHRIKTNTIDSPVIQYNGNCPNGRPREPRPRQGKWGRDHDSAT